MKTFNAQIHGLSPLLQHKFADGEEVSKKGSGKKVAAADYSKEELEYLYLMPDGKTIYQPASHLEGSMIKAANSFQIKGHKGKRYTERVKAFIRVEPDQVPHKNQTWHVDTRSVIIQRSRVLRRRPCFPDWSLEFQVRILDEEAIAPEMAHEILEYAGRYIGIGDYRPRYGLFEVTEWKEITK